MALFLGVLFCVTGCQKERELITKPPAQPVAKKAPEIKSEPAAVKPPLRPAVKAQRPVLPKTFAPAFKHPPVVRPNPNRNAPLAAIFECETDQPVQVEVRISDGTHSWTIASDDTLKTNHSLVLLGFRPEREHKVQIQLRDKAGHAITMPDELVFTSPSLPDDFPPLKVSTSFPERMEPGVTLFNVMQWRNDQANEEQGLIVIVDHTGEVLWYCKTDHPVSELRRLRNGNLIYLRSHRNKPLTAAIEIDMLGNVVNQWYAAGVTDQVPSGAIPVDVDTFHHEIYELKSGNLLGIGTEVRKLESYPTSETRRNKLQPANVVGDVIVEFRRDGSVVKKWKTHDLMDTQRIGYGSLSGFWDSRIYGKLFDGTKDWSHANAVDVDEEWMLVSLRHQDALVKIHRETGEIAWILSDPSGWRPEWRKHLLKREGELQWPYHQHAPMWTPGGTILVYDNGNYRARPFRKKTPGNRSYSRVVEYKVDEETKTVRQVWEFRGRGKEAFFSPLFGDADWMTKTGNVLITDGGRMFDVKGRSTDAIPGAHQWARIVEVTHATPSEVVFEMTIDSGAESGIGWSIYRCERLDGLQNPQFD